MRAVAQPARRPSANGQAEAVWEKLITLKESRQYLHAFAKATGLDLRFVSSQGLTPLGRVSGPHCGLLGRHAHAPAACTRKLRVQRADCAAHGTVICLCCIAAVTEVLVPVIIGDVHAGNLVVGPFCLRPPSRRDLNRLDQVLREREPRASARRTMQLRDDLHRLPVISEAKYRAAITLAQFFAQHLSESGHRLVLESAGRKSALVQKIEGCFAAQGTDVIPLTELARKVGLSRYNLCRQFKRETGLTLSEYRLRKRIERTKALLLDDNRRVCEAAFEAGFCSIPHFNRIFRRLVGCSPSAYRRRIHRANRAN